MKPESNKGRLTGNLTLNTQSASWAMGLPCSREWNFLPPQWGKHKTALGSLWQTYSPTPLPFLWYNLDCAPERVKFHGKARMARLYDPLISCLEVTKVNTPFRGLMSRSHHIYQLLIQTVSDQLRTHYCSKNTFLLQVWSSISLMPSCLELQKFQVPSYTDTENKSQRG